MTRSDGSRSGQPSTLSYLKLLHEESPGEVLNSFRLLLEKEPSVSVTRGDEFPEDLTLESFGEIQKDISEDRVEFLRWWVGQYRRDVARKHDSLTGLFNRSYWDRNLYPRLRSGHSSRSIILADIDYFKRFNDQYGHEMGDNVLEAVGSVLWNDFAATAQCVRYGGEEFLVVDSGPLQQVLERVEEFCETVRSGNLFDEQPEPVTLSVGLTGPSEGSKSLDERIGEADLALYSAKNRGRDRITEFSPYMKHRESLSVWGFYRYLWGRGFQFAFKNEKTFYVKAKGVIKQYSWSRDSLRTLSWPKKVDEIRSLQRVNHHLHALDASGHCWRYEESEWIRLDDDNIPRLVALTGGPNVALAAGMNNQIYRLERVRTHHRESLPERWERLIYLDGIYLQLDGCLERLSETDTRLGLPGTPQDFSSGKGKLVMSSKEGNLYVFDQSLNHWKQLVLPDFLDQKVQAEQVERFRNSFLIHDSHGRLFLAHKNHKSVPQKMRLDLI